MTATHTWQFASRFRRHAFGWRSDTPLQRIKEAIAEIKQVARKEAARRFGCLDIDGALVKMRNEN